MIELFAHKQICCEHCEFEFSFTGFESAAQIVCPACGEEIVLTPPPVAVESPPELTLKEPPILCSVEHCPLLTGDDAGGAVAKQLGLRIDKKKNRRRAILAWTVTLQVCVLLGVAFFIAKTLMVPHEEPVAQKLQPEVLMETLGDVFPLPLPGVPEIKMATQNPMPVVEPYLPVSVPEHPVSPYEIAQDFFLPPIDDYLPIDHQPLFEPNTLSAVAETTLPSPSASLERANELMESAKTVLATDPESSVEQAVRAAKIYKQLGQPFPDSMYWILGNAFASLVWGEPLLESSPAIETMTLSPDNRFLLAQLMDKSVWLWDLYCPAEDRSGFLLDSGTAEYVKFVFVFMPGQRWIIGGQRNGTIRIWDMNLRNPADTMITFAERIPNLQDMQLSPNGQWLVAYGNSPQGIVVSTEHPGPLPSQQPIMQVNYQRSVRYSSQDSSPYPVLLWNLRQMETGIVPMAIHVPPIPLPVQAIQFSPNSDRLAVARREAIVRVYDLSSRGVSDEPFLLRGHQFPVTQIAFAPSGQWVATGSQDNTIRLWNLTSTKVSPESATLYGHLGWISALAVDPTGEYLFSGSYDRTIRIWNIKRDRIGSALNMEPVVLETNLGIPESFSLTQDSDKIIVRGNEGSLGIYHLPSILENTLGEHYSTEYHRAITFRNSRLFISTSLTSSDDLLLIFSYEHLSNPANNGIRLWSLQSQAFVH